MRYILFCLLFLFAAQPVFPRMLSVKMAGYGSLDAIPNAYGYIIDPVDNSVLGFDVGDENGIHLFDLNADPKGETVLFRGLSYGYQDSEVSIKLARDEARVYVALYHRLDIDLGDFLFYPDSHHFVFESNYWLDSISFHLTRSYLDTTSANVSMYEGNIPSIGSITLMDDERDFYNLFLESKDFIKMLELKGKITMKFNISRTKWSKVLIVDFFANNKRIGDLNVFGNQIVNREFKWYVPSFSENLMGGDFFSTCTVDFIYME